MPISNPPLYSRSTQEKFRGLRWIPLTPELLDYDNTQVLVIGESIGIKEEMTEARKDVEEATKGGVDRQEAQEAQVSQDLSGAVVKLTMAAPEMH